MDKIKRIYEAFECSGQFISAAPYGSGRINETYLVKVDEEVEYILQRINGNIFTDIPKLIRNKELVSGHIRNRLIKHKISDITRKYITYFYTRKEKPYYKDYDGNYWTLTLFIKGSKNFDTVSSSSMAYEFGIGLGEFENRISDFDASLLIETIPFYHNIIYRQKELQHALSESDSEKKEKSKEIIDYLASLDSAMIAFQKMKDDGHFPLRVTHNDTKVSNLLFDGNNQPLCMIDLDTVMPGIVHYDFGDAVRSSCNSAGEEVQNLNQVHFNMEYFVSFTTGFMEKTKHLLTRKEKDTLGFSCQLMTYLQTSRFLTDYLSGDHYYSISYPDQNLQRAKVQAKLLKEIIKQTDRINQFITEQ